MTVAAAGLAGFIALIETTQRAYEERCLEDYLGAFSADYAGAQLGSDFSEDAAGLRERLTADMEKYQLISMDFEILRCWAAGPCAYSHMRYHTRLRHKTSGRVLVDKRENLVFGHPEQGGRWLLDGKIGLSAENYFEQPPPADQ